MIRGVNMPYLIIKDDAYQLISDYSSRLNIEPIEFIVAALRNQFELTEKYILDMEES